MSDKADSLSRARLSLEKGATYKDWGGRISVAIVYPSYYRVGMSNLGFQTVYGILNQREDVVAERAFLPEEQELSLHSGAVKGPLSIESKSPLSRFDIIAFSISFENDYPNILSILDSAGIPFLRAERNDSYPIVMAGGVTTFLNPEPLSDFFDLFLLGEAEKTLNEFINVVNKYRDEGERSNILRQIALECDFAYVPELYDVGYSDDGTISSRSCMVEEAGLSVRPAKQDAENLKICRSLIITHETEFSDRMLIEVGRGCGHSCRFCAAGYVYRPTRFHDSVSLIECVNDSMESCSRFGLLSASILDTPEIESVFKHIVEKGGRFSVSSLRADLLTEEVLDLLKSAGQKHLAIAPEAGTERLRRVINKHLSEEKILNAAGMIARAGDFSVRLYFLIGLPTETMEDIRAITELVKKIRHRMIKESRTRGSIGSIRLSVNCFIPKPFTPFQWFPMSDIKELKDKQKWLRKSLSKEGGVSITFDVPRWAYLQALLSLGDRRVGAILVKAHEYGNDFTKAFRDSKMNPDFFVHRPKKTNETLPWDFIDNRIKKQFLIKEYDLALKEKESGICDVGNCDRCGVCELFSKSCKG